MLVEDALLSLDGASLLDNTTALWFFATLLILTDFTEAGVGGGSGVSGLEKMWSFGATFGFRANILSRSISLPFVSPFSIRSTVTLSLSSFSEVTITLSRIST